MKKILAVITVLSVMFCCTITGYAKTAYKIGDVDTDNDISITDATKVQMFVAELYELNNVSQKLADVDGDNMVTVLDSTFIQLYLAQLLSDFPANSNPPSQGTIDKDGYFNEIVKP